jgi:uncharacterized protein YqcC (DUF446 family)
MNKTPTPPATTPATTEERLEAIEFLLSQTLLALEADSAAIHTRLDRLQAAMRKAAPGALQQPSGDDDESNPAFTMDALGQWVQTCLERMRAHQTATARQMVAIGELTERVLGLGLDADAAHPPIGQAAQAAMEKAKRPPARD